MKEPSSTPTGPSHAPGFKEVRKYLNDISQREALGEFIKAGWSPAELSEYARSTYLAAGRTYPTAASYQTAITFGPESSIAKIILAQLRVPGYEMPPFNRPVPPPPPCWDDQDHPDHTPEIRAAVKQLALCFRNRRAKQNALPAPASDGPVSRKLWKSCFRLLNRYGSLERALQIEGLHEYSEPYREFDHR
jgi:hypothetical protein